MQIRQRLKVCNANTPWRTVTCIWLALLVSRVLSYSTGSKNNKQQAAVAAQPHENAALDKIAAHNQPHFKPQRTAIVELFEWKFSDVAHECVHFLGPKGYAGVQLSPVTEHLVFSSAELSHPWWERYYPISYKIATRSGDAAEFLAMSQACNKAGIRIYVDVVLNHMAGWPHKATDKSSALPKQTMKKPASTSKPTPIPLLQGSAGSVANLSVYDYPAVPFAAQDFHKPCAVENYLDTYAIRNCQLNGRPDLDHSRPAVRQRIVSLLNKLLDMGVAGFRVSAAKYIWPVDLKLITAEVKNLNSQDFDFPENSRPFFYYDVFDIGTDAISKTEYSGYGMVTEYLYAPALATVLSGKVPLSSLINWGPAMGFLSHPDAVVFVDSHVQQRQRDGSENQRVTYRQRRKYVMANAFMLAHPYGRVKRIMSSYYYDKQNAAQGPPGEAEGNAFVIRSPAYDEGNQCTTESGWVCEHRWPWIARMIPLVNALSEAQDIVINFQTNGPNQIAFCRGHKAFIAINNDPTLDYAREVNTCLPQGVYCDVMSGGRADDGVQCIGKRVVVNEEGNADILLPANPDDDQLSADNVRDDVNEAGKLGVIAIYLGSKLQVEGEESEGEVEKAAVGGVQENEVKGNVEDNATDVEGKEGEEQGLNEKSEGVEEKMGDAVEGVSAIEKENVAKEDEKEVEKEIEKEDEKEVVNEEEKVDIAEIENEDQKDVGKAEEKVDAKEVEEVGRDEVDKAAENEVEKVDKKEAEDNAVAKEAVEGAGEDKRADNVEEQTTIEIASAAEVETEIKAVEPNEEAKEFSAQEPTESPSFSENPDEISAMSATAGTLEAETESQQNATAAAAMSQLVAEIDGDDVAAEAEDIELAMEDAAANETTTE